MKTVRRSAPRLGLVLCALALVACRPYVGGRPGAPQVALWGDSITNDATPRLRGVFEQEYATAVWSYPGIVVRQADTEAQSQIDYDPPNAFVVELGTNNIRDGDVDLEDLADIQHLADLLRPSGCVVWVTVATTKPELIPVAAELDAFLETLPATRPWVHVADWNRVALTHPEWFRDGIHHTPAGIAAYAGWLRGQTEQLCGVRPVR